MYFPIISELVDKKAKHVFGCSFLWRGGGVNKSASICNKCVFRFTDLDCNDTVSELLVPATEPLPLIV